MLCMGMMPDIRVWFWFMSRILIVFDSDRFFANTRSEPRKLAERFDLFVELG